MGKNNTNSILFYRESTVSGLDVIVALRCWHVRSAMTPPSHFPFSLNLPSLCIHVLAAYPIAAYWSGGKHSCKFPVRLDVCSVFVYVSYVSRTLELALTQRWCLFHCLLSATNICILTTGHIDLWLFSLGLKGN